MLTWADGSCVQSQSKLHLRWHCNSSHLGGRWTHPSLQSLCIGVAAQGIEQPELGRSCRPSPATCWGPCWHHEFQHKIVLCRLVCKPCWRYELQGKMWTSSGVACSMACGTFTAHAEMLQNETFCCRYDRCDGYEVSYKNTHEIRSLSQLKECAAQKLINNL